MFESFNNHMRAAESSPPPPSPEMLKKQQKAELMSEGKKMLIKRLRQDRINELVQEGMNILEAKERVYIEESAGKLMPSDTELEELKKYTDSHWEAEFGTHVPEEVVQDTQALGEVLAYKGDEKEGDTYVIPEYKKRDDNQKAA